MKPFLAILLSSTVASISTLSAQSKPEMVRLGEIETVKLPGMKYDLQCQFESCTVNITTDKGSQVLLVYIGPTNMFANKSESRHHPISKSMQNNLPVENCSWKTPKQHHRIFEMKLPNSSGYVFTQYTLPISTDTTLQDKLIDSIRYIPKTKNGL